MVRCKSCGRTTFSPKAKNWQEWQLCYACAKKLHPEAYEGIAHHGTGKSRMDAPAKSQSLVDVVVIRKQMNSMAEHS